MSQVYDQAYLLLKSGDAESINAGLDLLRQETESRPWDMKALFDYAGAYDFLGREAEALPLYEKVLGGIDGLPADDQPRLFVQLGSTLRNLEETDGSRQVLTEGLRRFPQNGALHVFLALTEYSAGNHRGSMRLLLDMILSGGSQSSIKDYSTALRWYSDNL